MRVPSCPTNIDIHRLWVGAGRHFLQTIANSQVCVSLGNGKSIPMFLVIAIVLLIAGA